MSENSPEPEERKPLVVAGIGASAGGLEALEQFFSHVTANGGIAYVVIQHLAPQHVSMLTELLGRRTTMEVIEAKHGVPARADCVHVIAPGTLLGISGGVFQVKSLGEDRHGQIDAFLQTLAADQRERAIGVILSGSGGDGTDGLHAIKEHGGLTLAQTPETAKYDAMPRSAVQAGVVDHVLPAEEMPAKLLERARQVADRRGPLMTPSGYETPLDEAMFSSDQVVTLADMTRIKRAEAVVQRLATVVLDSNDAVTVQDLDGQILEWNRGAERIYGYSVSEARQMNAEALVPEGERAQTRAIFDAVRHGDEVEPREVRRRAKDGRTIDVWLTITKLVDEHHRPFGVATTERDITDRKRAEEALRASEEKYRTLFESIDEGFCLIEVLFDDSSNPLDYRFLEVNRVFEKQTGIANAVGRRMRAIAPEHEEHWFRIYGRVALTGEPLRFENPAVALGRYYDVYAFRVGKPEERQVAILFHDITARKQMEMERGRLIQDLHEAQEEMTADLDAMSRLLGIGSLFVRGENLEPVLGAIIDTAIAISGADYGTFQLWDRASGRLKIVAYRGLPKWWVEHWDTVHDGQGSCGTALARGERIVVADVEQSPIFAGTPDLEVQRKAGVRAVQSTPLLGRAGEPLGILSTHYGQPRAPSERALRLLDLLCRQAADILERARAEQKLGEANERLREADRQKDEFLAMLSHELRNPLMPICSSIDILNRTAPGGEQARRAQAVIDRQVGHLTRLIEDLLDITRIHSGKVRLQRERLDLNELARRAVEDHRAAFIDSGVELEMRAATGGVWVNADRTRLSQAIGNLLQNAIKFTVRGGKATVCVETDLTRERAIVRVQDTGRGIAPEILPRVFEPFVQADRTLDRSKGGLGLGLALAKGLIEMQGGSIGAASGGPDKGATFTITLPIDAAGPTETQPPRASIERAIHRVLIIEDNVDAADSLHELLELDGYDVEVAYTGPEGIEKARAFRPEVVLCDIGLPETDGYEVARIMRADHELDRVGLVALTGYTRPEDVAKAREAGFDGHLGKPPSKEGIQHVLTEVGARSPSRGLTNV